MTNDGAHTRSTHSELLDATLEFGAALRHRAALSAELEATEERLNAIRREIQTANERIERADAILRGFFVGGKP